MQVEDKGLQNGSGTTVQDINKFIKSFEMTQKMMKQMKNNKGGMKKLLNGIDENALKNCTGDYIFLSDQDDVWKDDKVETILPLLEKYAFVVHDTEMADENLNVFATSQFERYKVKPGFWNTLARNRYNGCCMAFTRDFLNKALPFPKNQNLCRYDYWLPYLAEYKHISYTLYEPLILYRRHEGTALNAGEGSSRGFVEKIFSRVYCLFEVIKRAPVFH